MATENRTGHQYAIFHIVLPTRWCMWNVNISHHQHLYCMSVQFISNVRPCSHLKFYPTRVPLANGTRRVAGVHTASTASGSSGTLRPHLEVFSVDANLTRRVGAAVWMLEWTRRVRQWRAVCACLQTNRFISTPLICNAANRARKNHDTVG